MKRNLSIFLLPIVLTMILLPPARSAQEQNLSPALAALVAAERAFAQLSVEKGVRESFLTFFADDGIDFQPHPTLTKEAFRKRPAPATPPSITLDWDPIFADISRAGDLGYTTGPYTITDHSPQQRPAQHGYYVSIWRKQPDGTWKVAVDLGISTPAPPTDAPAPTFQPPHQAHDKAHGNVNLAAERTALLAADRALLQAESERGGARALPDQMTIDARLHRNDLFPVVGQRAVRAYLKDKTEMKLTGVPIKADVAQSGDLGYTYGNYEQKDGVSTERGYYVRVWLRAGSKWRVALDTTSPLPPESK